YARAGTTASYGKHSNLAIATGVVSHSIRALVSRNRKAMAFASRAKTKTPMVAFARERSLNRALSLTALRLRRYFIEIAFAPDDSHPRTSGIAGRTRRRGGGVASRGAGAAAGEDPAHRHYRRLAPLERLPSRVARSRLPRRPEHRLRLCVWRW